MVEEARSRLGRGLASLIGDVGGEAAHLDRPRAQRKVPIEFLKPNPRNPRRDFSDTELGELADSIKQHGVIQPIVVRPVRGVQDRYEIIAGERRWRASQIAGLHEVLRRQGLLEGTWCLNPQEELSPGQSEEIDRVLAAYPHLTDDEFVAENLDEWLG